MILGCLDVQLRFDIFSMATVAMVTIKVQTIFLIYCNEAS